MRAVTREVNHGAILDIKVRTIRTVAGRVHNVDLRVVDRNDKGARETGTAVIGGVGRATLDIHVVAAVAAIPLKGVLLVVLNGEVRTILQVKLVIAAEIDGMNVTGTGAIHGKRSAIERERGILARAHRHPFPLGGIRSGANAGHACIDVLEHKRVAPKGNALVGELQRVAIAVDGEVLVQIKARSLGIGKELDGRAVSFLGDSKRFIKGRVLGPVKLCDRSTVPCARRSTCGNRSRGGSGRSRFGRRGDRRARFVRRRGIDLGLGNRAHRRRLNGRLGNRSKTVIRKSLRCKKAEGCHKPCCYRKNGMGAFFHGMPFLSYRARQNAGTTFLRHYSYGISEIRFRI